MSDTRPTAQQVAQLRGMTGASVTACRDALTASGCDIQRAIDALKVAGELKSSAIAAREVREGAVEAYVHTNSRVCAMVEIGCETDFAARTDDFKRLCRDVAMHVAAHDPEPLSVAAGDLPQHVVERETAIVVKRVSAEHAKKPEHLQHKIVSGQLSKWKRDVCLLEQTFIRDATQTVGELVAAVSAKLGERVSVRRFAKFAVGSQSS